MLIPFSWGHSNQHAFAAPLKPTIRLVPDGCESDDDCPAGLECYHDNPTYFKSYCRPVKRKDFVQLIFLD